MGLLDKLIAGAQKSFEENRGATRTTAKDSSQNQDAGWTYQIRLRREYLEFGSGPRSYVTHVSGLGNNGPHTVEAGLLSPKRRTLIKDASNAKVATLKVARLKGFGGRVTIDVSFGDKHVGKVYEYTGEFMGIGDPVCYFDPLGLRLEAAGKMLEPHFEIKDARGNVVAVIYQSNGSCKISFNNHEGGLYYLAMWLAKREIFDRRIKGGSI